MENYRVVPSLFFDDHRAFPWDILGYGVPKWGPVHSYVCSILAPLSNRYEKPLLEGRPSIREVGRMARISIDLVNSGQLQLAEFETPFVCPDIYKYCSDLYGYRKENRKDVAQEVLDCLRRFEFYQEWLRERLTLLWKENLIIIPREYLQLVLPPEEDEKKGYWRRS